MATAALKKIATEVEKVAKGVENASRKGKKPKQGEEDLDNKALTGLVINLKNALEQLVAYVGKEENFCPKLKDQEKRTRQLEDLTDDIQQKSLVGSFIITSRANDEVESLITPEKELKEPLIRFLLSELFEFPSFVTVICGTNSDSGHICPCL